MGDLEVLKRFEFIKILCVVVLWQLLHIVYRKTSQDLNVISCFVL